MSNTQANYISLTSDKKSTFDIDYVQQAKDLLLFQFRDKPKTNGLLEGLLEPTKEINQLSIDMVDNYNIMVAQGTQLDNIGKLLNIIRRGVEPDDVYRSRILARITINRATGTAPNLVDNLKLLLPNVRFTVIEVFPASVQVLIFGIQNVVDKDLVNDLVPIGVSGIFFSNPYEDKDVWELSNADSSGTIPIENENPLSILPDVAGIPTSNLVLMDIAFISA